MKHMTGGLDDPSRRTFVSGTALAALGVGAMPWLDRLALARQEAGKVKLNPATAKNVIYLFMSGGMTHLDTFDPKPGHENQGPTEVLKTNADGVRVSQHFPNMAKQMDKVAVINSVTSNQGAHAQGRYLMHTSYVMRGTIKHPSIGAWLNLMDGKANPTLPGHVSIGGGNNYGASAGFMESRYAPLPIGDPNAGLQNSRRPRGVSEEAYRRRLARAEKLNKAFATKFNQKKVRAYSDMYDEAIKLMKSKDLEAFDLTKEPEAIREAYGRNNFGQGVLLARRLVEHGVRFIEVQSGGWDTHSQNFTAMETRCPPLDRAMAALLADLESRGMLEETLVVLASEFGRTPQIRTERMGRDHYPKAFTCLLAGGGVKGGRTYGKTDKGGEEVVENKVNVPDFNATIAYALGLPLDHVVYSPSKRPFTVVHKGRPVTAIF